METEEAAKVGAVREEEGMAVEKGEVAMAAGVEGMVATGEAVRKERRCPHPAAQPSPRNEKLASVCHEMHTNDGFIQLVIESFQISFRLLLIAV